MDFLDTINDALVDRFGVLGPLYAIGLLGVLLIALSLPVFLARKQDPLDRLKEETRTRRTAPDKDAPKGGKALRQERSRATEKLDKYATFLEPQDAEEMSSARLTMMRAGYRSKAAVRAFHAAQLILGLGFLLLGCLAAVLKSANGDASMQSMILYVLIPGAIGYYLPKYWVQRRLQSRQQEIVEGFPDSLDMMLVCVEAGQSLEQAIIRVSKETRAGYPALSEEFEIVSHEMKAGKDKVSVLKDMSARCGVPDVSSFITVLIQSASFGTSIAEALRIFAAEMRDKRVMRAEEKANVLPTKLTLGTMMFTVPPLLIILIGPSIYDIYVMMILNG
ncbi:type II secretion system F family protein [Tropicimonas sp. IMCC34011]|uniref:type II secretion system F family protein n=1 Tax=Tropicimonas sp. IMCC34011 TaxID=2248759 RepID=UPI000E22104F|nr:type II secretion system F family protein [Tropicimonas sp. IMCC34011]